MPGSAPKQLNTRDWWNVGKHILLVSGATALTTLAQHVPMLLDTLGAPVLTTLATGLLTLLARWLQDNR